MMQGWITADGADIYDSKLECYAETFERSCVLKTMATGYCPKQQHCDAELQNQRQGLYAALVDSMMAARHKMHSQTFQAKMTWKMRGSRRWSRRKEEKDASRLEPAIKVVTDMSRSGPW